jgi:hypothetical protein
VTVEEWALVASVVFSGAWSGLMAGWRVAAHTESSATISSGYATRAELAGALDGDHNPRVGG